MCDSLNVQLDISLNLQLTDSVVWDKVIKMLWSEKKTHADIASNLNIPVEEIVELLFGVFDVQTERLPAAVPLSLLSMKANSGDAA